jgi:hypothetical protein
MSTTNYSDLLPDIIPMAPEAPDMLIVKHVKETVIDFCQRTNIYQHEQTIDAFKDVSDYTLVPPTNTIAHRILWANYDGRDLEAISPSLKEQRSPKWRDSATSTGGTPEYFIKDGQTKLVIIPMPSTDDAKVLTASVAGGGTSYSVDEAVAQASTSGSGTGFTIKVTAIGGSDAITAFDITNPGRGHNAGDTITLATSGGSAATITVGTVSDGDSLRVRMAVRPTRASTNCDTEIMDDYRDAIVNGAVFRLLRVPGQDFTDYTAAGAYGTLYEDQVRETERRARQGDTAVARKVKYGGLQTIRGTRKYSGRKLYRSNTL